MSASCSAHRLSAGSHRWSAWVWRSPCCPCCSRRSPRWPGGPRRRPSPDRAPRHTDYGWSHRVRAVSEPGNAYRTVVVGTDGSDSSLRAVTRAGSLAGACGATLVIACAYLPAEADDRELTRAQDALGEDAYQIVGSHPAEDTVRTAQERAGKAGAKDVKTVAVEGSPVEALLDVVRRENADLLV